MRRLFSIICSVAVVATMFNAPTLTMEIQALTLEAQSSGEGTQASGEGTQASGEGIQSSGEETQISDEGIQSSDEGTQSPDAGIQELPQVGMNEIEDAQVALQEILADRTVMALVYLSDEYPVRVEANYKSETVVTVPSGQQVQIQDVSLDDNNERWMYVTLYYKEIQYAGYIPRSYLACSDEVFLEWEKNNFVSQSVKARTMAVSYAEIEQFPESYRELLTALKIAHPNWTFVKFDTRLDWNTVVQNEMVQGRSLVPSSFPAYMQDGLYSSGWAYATEDILKYYLDPRNGLNETTVFQFEQLTYNESYHTQAAVQSFLNSTFMKGTLPDDSSMTYAAAFCKIGKELGVSPFHLACRVYQEQGQGTSPLISGKYSGYEGYYNYFNIGASGTTNTAIYVSGLKKAKDNEWNTVYKSLYGGAYVISANYILKGQDTLYLQKFDVDSSSNGLYWHQYMQNICAPSSEGQNIRKSYETVGAVNNTFVFRIPVYNNMPAAACAAPTSSLEIGLTPPTGYTDAKIYLDGVEYTATLRNGRYVVKAPDTNASTAVMYKYNESNVPIGMYVWTLTYSNGAYTATAVPELEDLLTYHGFSIRIVGKSGIRFKTGISTDLRGKLTTTGVSGYTLKEYGTLVMNNANRVQYPLIKGGEKVAVGRSYGQNESGVLEDLIYETSGGRYRFTSVLVGMPATQYKSEFAFRGYIVLTKNGKDITLYGPTVWRSIYSLTKQVLDNGQYEAGSSADQFLRQLISDADSVSN